ncbi:MAG: hypothetical protein K6T63_00595, partial [Alicyclobacillus herbarius]|nr:hypothetical protein [Alicyclobacillus herbarius]
LQQYAKEHKADTNKHPHTDDENDSHRNNRGLSILGTVKKETRQIVEKRLEEVFSPEFLNRIDDIITFNWLDEHTIDSIIQMELSRLNQRLTKHGYQVSLDESAISLLREIGFDTRFGARSLKRCLRRYVELPLADFLFDHENQLNQQREEAEIEQQLPLERAIVLIGSRSGDTVYFHL